jgi:PucR family transcriptional regulator, purine catabolism regulatory protein
LLPTVAELLQLPELQSGDPLVVAGSSRLANPVRWVHVSELWDIASLLQGGELLLSTGIAFPSRDSDLELYIASLTKVGVSGLVIELGRRFTFAPQSLISAAEQAELPLIILQREVAFVRVTEAAHSLIINQQLDALRTTESIHRTFTELAIDGATLSGIVSKAAQIMQLPVIFENLAHQALVYDLGGRRPDLILDGWEHFSRRLPVTKLGVESDAGLDTVTTMVGARGETWGRLVAVMGETRLRSTHIMVLESAAMAIALNRLVERDRESLEQHGQRSLLSDVRSGANSASELASRAIALGFPVKARSLVGLIINTLGTASEPGLDRDFHMRDQVEKVAAAARSTRTQAIVGFVKPGMIGMLLSLPLNDAPDTRMLLLAQQVHRSLKELGEDQVVIGAGSVVQSMRDVRRSLIEAEQVVKAAELSGEGKAYYELLDVRLRGLLHMMQDDVRLHTFVERELAPLIARDKQEGDNLLAVLWAYLEAGMNKTKAAKRCGLSRPAFYDRLSRITSVLRIDLDSVESCISLYVAMLALNSVRRGTSARQ